MFLYSETLLENLFGTLFLVTSALDGQSIFSFVIAFDTEKNKNSICTKVFPSQD